MYKVSEVAILSIDTKMLSSTFFGYNFTLESIWYILEYFGIKILALCVGRNTVIVSNFF